MTDRQRWIDFLNAFGIHWEDCATQNPRIDLTNPHYADILNDIWIPSYGGDPDLGRNEGYGGFVAHIYFDTDGNFTKIGIWE